MSLNEKVIFLFSACLYTLQEPCFPFFLQAYAIMMLHASKYPSRPVTGILLGNKTHEAQMGKNQKTGTFSYDIVKAVPLSHHYLLAPMMEIAMTQVTSTLGTLRASFTQSCDV
jgi:hypothetical protein